MTLSREQLEENIRKVREKLASVCKKCNRDSNEVTLLAATKTVPGKVVEWAIHSGISCIGENRLQEAADKFPKIPSINNIEKHFIGSLQSNKVKHAVRMFDVIESVDTLKCAKLIDKEAQTEGKVMPVLVEVNIGEEENKSGVLPNEVESFCTKLLSFTNLKAIGLMAIPPYDKNPRPFFKQMKQLYDTLGFSVLSMGMSNDYTAAVEDGSTLVRLGTALFGRRDNL